MHTSTNQSLNNKLAAVSAFPPVASKAWTTRSRENPSCIKLATTASGKALLPPPPSPRRGSHPPPPIQIIVQNVSYSVKFPFPEPYPSQIVMMEKILFALREGTNALLESPTGTGKTVCLLCATLAFAEHEEKQRIKQKNTKKKNTKKSSERSNSWVCKLSGSRMELTSLKCTCLIPSQQDQGSVQDGSCVNTCAAISTVCTRRLPTGLRPHVKGPATSFCTRSFTVKTISHSSWTTYWFVCTKSYLRSHPN